MFRKERPVVALFLWMLAVLLDCWSVCMHVTAIPTCMNFLSQFQLIKFSMTMDYSPCPERVIWPFLKGSHISDIKEAMPTKTGVHALDINPYLHKFFELILIDQIFPLLQSCTVFHKMIVHIWSRDGGPIFWSDFNFVIPL